MTQTPDNANGAAAQVKSDGGKQAEDADKRESQRQNGITFLILAVPFLVLWLTQDMVVFAGVAIAFGVIGLSQFASLKR